MKWLAYLNSVGPLLVSLAAMGIVMYIGYGMVSDALTRHSDALNLWVSVLGR